MSQCSVTRSSAEFYRRDDAHTHFLIEAGAPAVYPPGYRRPRMTPRQLQKLLADAIEFHRAGRLGDALARYERVLAADPNQFDANHLAGLVALQEGRAAEAVRLLERAQRMSTGDRVCAMRLALAYSAFGRHAEAETRLRRIVEAAPDWHEAWENLGTIQQRQGRNGEAIGSYRRAVAIRPDYASGWCNLGLALLFEGQADEALSCQDRALAADPCFARALRGRAMALHHLHRMPEAAEAYAAAIRCNPGDFEARSYRLMALEYLDTSTRDSLFAEHKSFGAAVTPASPPKRASDKTSENRNSSAASPERSASSAVMSSRRPYRGAPAQVSSPSQERGRGRGSDRKLSVGLLSPDLRQHSVAYFIEPILRHLDRRAFDLFLYHDHPCVDAVSERLKSLSSKWRNFAGQPGPAVASQIRSDAPDILIDLAGHSGLNRLPLYAERLAPVQITYLGYPDTTGLPTMDFRLVDGVTDPIGSADTYHTETLIRFAPTAWTYVPPAEAPEPARRAGASTGVVFGSCNTLAKLSDATARSWSALLAAVPGSTLRLKAPGLEKSCVRTWLLNRLSAAGIAPARVDCHGWTAQVADHLAFYHTIDVALDPFPYNGTTTTCEALWMGVPVVTLLGDRHAGRVGASLLAAAGCANWIAASPAEYVRIAAALAANEAARASLRSSLRQQLRASILLDHAGQAERFGAALRRCWEQAASGDTRATEQAVA